MSRRKPVQLPPIVIHVDMPCKSGQQPFVAADGSCLRCGADQGVHGYACGDTFQRQFQREVASFDALITPPREGSDYQMEVAS